MHFKTGALDSCLRGNDGVLQRHDRLQFDKTPTSAVTSPELAR